MNITNIILTILSLIVYTWMIWWYAGELTNNDKIFFKIPTVITLILITSIALGWSFNQLLNLIA